MVKLIIDSGSDVSKVQADELGIMMVPMEIQFGDECFYDGVDLLPGDFFEKLVVSKELPHTSLINEYRWKEAFEEATKNGDEVIAIVLSSKLSGTYNSAKEAAKSFDGKVFVVDSLSATLGERLLAQYAERLIAEGLSAKEVFEKLEEKKTKLHIYAMIDTLKYLKMGGRISATTAFFGELLSIKPIIEVSGGEVKVIGKEKGMKNVHKNICGLVEKTGGIDFDMPYGTLWSGNDKTSLNKFVELCNHLWSADSAEIQQHEMGSTIGTHIGPGAFAIVYFEK